MKVLSLALAKVKKCAKHKWLKMQFNRCERVLLYPYPTQPEVHCAAVKMIKLRGLLDEY